MLYALTCGRHQQPVHTKQTNIKHQKLKYKQWKCKLCEGGYYALNNMILEHKISTIADLMESPLARVINLALNYCDCEGTTKDLVFNWVHPLFLKAHAEASKEDNPNWNQAMNGSFTYEYWKTVCTELEDLEGMVSWNVLDHKDDMNII